MITHTRRGMLAPKCRRFGVGVFAIMACATLSGVRAAEPTDGSAGGGAGVPTTPAMPPAPAVEPGSDPAPAAKGAPSAVPAKPSAAPIPEDSEIIVYLKDGQRLTGMLVSATEDEVRVRIAGISTPLRTEMIEKYEILPPITERYLELRAAVGNDPEQIVQLAKWLREREKYEMALAEITRALEIDRNTPEAKSLKVQLEQQILLKQRGGKQGENGNGERKPEASKARPVRRPADFPQLTADQINLIKVYEIDLAARPRVIVARETITRLLEQNAGHPLVPITREGRESWYRKDALEILELMFRLQARNLYSQVQVLDQPQKFEIFRDDVHRTWLLNKCATNECHGGEEAGRLMLCNKRPNSDATVYTNFLILNNYTLADGTKLINTEEPGKSPLLQIGLPREDSLFPHPPVRNVAGTNGRDTWRPVFAAADDRMFMETIEWIRLLFRPRPDYGIAYTPPIGRSSSLPDNPPTSGGAGIPAPPATAPRSQPPAPPAVPPSTPNSPSPTASPPRSPPPAVPSGVPGPPAGGAPDIGRAPEPAPR